MHRTRGFCCLVETRGSRIANANSIELREWNNWSKIEDDDLIVGYFFASWEWSESKTWEGRRMGRNGSIQGRERERGSMCKKEMKWAGGSCPLLRWKSREERREEEGNKREEATTWQLVPLSLSLSLLFQTNPPYRICTRVHSDREEDLVRGSIIEYSWTDYTFSSLRSREFVSAKIEREIDGIVRMNEEEVREKRKVRPSTWPLLFQRWARPISVLWPFVERDEGERNCNKSHWQVR